LAWRLERVSAPWRPLSGPVGAERDDVDFKAADPEEIRAALYEHQLLVLRGQSLDPASYAEAAGKLGELDVYPYAEPISGHPHVVAVVKEPGDESNFGGDWHTDTAYVSTPPAITLLYAVEVPEQGGDTLFADTVGAFEGCSEGFKAALRGLTGHNTASLVHQSGGGYASVTGQSVTLKDTDRETEADHPLVVAHPETWREALFFSLIHTSHFVGMTRLESLPLLESLHERVTAPENVSRLRWQPGTLAIWDNRAVQHYPLNDYPGKRREMYRIILKGDRPKARSGQSAR
jgi:taurine dioxygenase